MAAHMGGAHLVSHIAVYAVLAIVVLSPVAHFHILGPKCTAQPMYVLKPTCSYYRKWCRSDDDAHTNATPGGQLLCHAVFFF